MKTVIFNTVNAIFEFDHKETNEIIQCNRSKYDLDEVAKLLDLISANRNNTIVIPEEPHYFDLLALDLIGAGNGSALCKACNKKYLARQLKTITVGCGGRPISVSRDLSWLC